MILTSLKLNALSTEALRWYQRFVTTFKSADSEALAPFLHEDVVVELNSILPFYGKQTAGMALERFWLNIGQVQYEPLNIYGDQQRFSAELLGRHRPPIGAPITLPLAVFYDRDAAGLLTSMRVFMDLQPIYGAST